MASVFHWNHFELGADSHSQVLESFLLFSTHFGNYTSNTKTDALILQRPVGIYQHFHLNRADVFNGILTHYRILLKVLHEIVSFNEYRLIQIANLIESEYMPISPIRVVFK